MNNLKDFLQGTRQGRAWLNFDFGEVYVRNALRRSPDAKFVRTLDIANINVEQSQQGQGKFTQWLAEVEKIASERNIPLFIENVGHPRFQNFFLKRGYVLHTHTQDSCFWKNP